MRQFFVVVVVVAKIGTVAPADWQISWFRLILTWHLEWKIFSKSKLDTVRTILSKFIYYKLSSKIGQYLVAWLYKTFLIKHFW